MVFNILRNLSIPTLLLLLVAELEGRNFDQKLHLREQRNSTQKVIQNFLEVTSSFFC